MKKFKTVLTAIVMLFTFTAFATEPTPDKVSYVVQTAFKNDFSKASDVKWDRSEGFYFASFTLNAVTVDAAYTEEGELVGTARRIAKDQMPLSISLALASEYQGYEVSKSVIELTHENVTRYYATVSNAKETVSLKCFSSRDLEVERRTKNK